MRVVVNLDRCEGNLVCEANAPRVFRVNDDDQAEVLVDDVVPEDRASVEDAIRLCPRQALSWAEGAAGRSEQ
jgi:ferredoxin